jgi:hypothetical protein
VIIGEGQVTRNIPVRRVDDGGTADGCLVVLRHLLGYTGDLEPSGEPRLIFTKRSEGPKPRNFCLQVKNRPIPENQECTGSGGNSNLLSQRISQ